MKARADYERMQLNNNIIDWANSTLKLNRDPVSCVLAYEAQANAYLDSIEITETGEGAFYEAVFICLDKAIKLVEEMEQNDKSDELSELSIKLRTKKVDVINMQKIELEKKQAVNSNPSDAAILANRWNNGGLPGSEEKNTKPVQADHSAGYQTPTMNP